MSVMASQITVVLIVCSTVSSCPDQRKHQGSASLAFVRGIHQWPGNSPHKGPVTRKIVPFDDVIMSSIAIRNIKVFFLNPTQSLYIYIYISKLYNFLPIMLMLGNGVLSNPICFAFVKHICVICWTRVLSLKYWIQVAILMNSSFFNGDLVFLFTVTISRCSYIIDSIR